MLQNLEYVKEAADT